MTLGGGLSGSATLVDDADVAPEPGRAVQVDPIKPVLKAPGTMRLKLKYGKLLSSFAVKSNLRRYSLAERESLTSAGAPIVRCAPVGPGRCYPPRQPTHFESALLELNGVL